MSQIRLSRLAIKSIEKKIAKEINTSDISFLLWQIRSSEEYFKF